MFCRFCSRYLCCIWTLALDLASASFPVLAPAALLPVLAPAVAPAVAAAPALALIAAPAAVSIVALLLLVTQTLTLTLAWGLRTGTAVLQCPAHALIPMSVSPP